MVQYTRFHPKAQFLNRLSMMAQHAAITEASKTSPERFEWLMQAYLDHYPYEAPAPFIA